MVHYMDSGKYSAQQCALRAFGAEPGDLLLEVDTLSFRGDRGFRAMFAFRKISNDPHDNTALLAHASAAVVRTENKRRIAEVDGSIASSACRGTAGEIVACSSSKAKAADVEAADRAQLAEFVRSACREGGGASSGSASRAAAEGGSSDAGWQWICEETEYEAHEYEACAPPGSHRFALP